MYGTSELNIILELGFSYFFGIPKLIVLITLNPCTIWFDDIGDTASYVIVIEKVHVLIGAVKPLRGYYGSSRIQDMLLPLRVIMICCVQEVGTCIVVLYVQPIYRLLYPLSITLEWLLMFWVVSPVADMVGPIIRFPVS